MRELIFWMNEKIFGNNKNQFMLGKLNFCLILKFVVEDRVRNQMEELEMEIIWPLQQKWNKYIILISHLKAKSFSFFIEGRSQSRYKLWFCISLKEKKYSLVNYFLWQFYLKEKTSKVIVIFYGFFAQQLKIVELYWHGMSISVFRTCFLFVLQKMTFFEGLQFQVQWRFLT